MMRLAVAWIALTLVSGCVTTDTERVVATGPYAVVLGTAQDGGFPQIGARHALAMAARRDPDRRRLVTSLLVADPRNGTRYLFDASPDIVAQVERAAVHPPNRVVRDGRPPLFDGVFLTHAHIGHYAGLLQFGREAYGAEGQVVYGSERMGRFLTENGPWNLLIEAGYIEFRALKPEVPLELGEGLSVTPFLVPHRAEFTDTFGYRIDGPGGSIAYLPDIDKWERWDVPLEQWLDSIDTALIDGTFYENGEIPGRDMDEIPHPFIEETVARLSDSPRALREKVVFTHLNHTNRASVPGGEAQRELEASGYRVAHDRMILPLGR